jgi:hypothetical protein
MTIICEQNLNPRMTIKSERSEYFILIETNEEMVLTKRTVGCIIVKENNNNQPFYSQASWGMLEMKLHE